MKKNLFVVIILSSICSSAQVQNELLEPKRKFFPPRTSDAFLPYKTQLSFFSGVEFNPEMFSLLICLEMPTSSRISFMTSFGYGIGGTYNYSQDNYDDALIPLNSDKLNFQINSGFHFNIRDINVRSNYFFGLNMIYSNAYYSGQHYVTKNWKFHPSILLFNNVEFPEYYERLDVHTNEFELRAESIGLQLYLGWKAIILNRLPFEISLGCALRKQKQELTNYVASTEITSDFTKYDPFATPFITFKLGYILYKN